MSKLHKDILACVLCSCLRTSYFLADVCWVDLFKALLLGCLSPNMGFEVSPFVMWTIFVGSFRSVSWGLKCLPPFVDVGPFDWDSKCLPLYVGA